MTDPGSLTPNPYDETCPSCGLAWSWCRCWDAEIADAEAMDEEYSLVDQDDDDA